MENKEISPNLLLMSKESSTYYSPGRWLIWTKKPKCPEEPYNKEDISIEIVQKPELSENMKKVYNSRMKNIFPNGIQRDGEFLGMQSTNQTKSKIHLPLYLTCFSDWKLTLPNNSESDKLLEKKCLRSCFCIHHTIITADNHLIYVTRGDSRASWQNTILCTHSWGINIDKDYAGRAILEDLQQGQGSSLIQQAKKGVCREINPFQEKDSKNPDKILEHLILPNNIKVNPSCLTLHLKPYDYGYHLCFTAYIDKEVGDILEKRKNYPFLSRVKSYESIEFNKSNMIDFFNKNHNNLATTVEPTIVMACVQNFGRDFLKKLPYEVLKPLKD